MKKITEVDRAEILRRLRQGETQTELANAYGVSQPAISYAAKVARATERDAEQNSLRDAFPDRNAAELKYFFWKHLKAFYDLINNRQRFLKTDASEIETAIEKWERAARGAPTIQQEIEYKARAASYKTELQMLGDVGVFDDEILEVLTEMQAIAETLIKCRGEPLGREKI